MSQATLSPTVDPSARLGSLDAYRGFVMICLAANGFGIAATAKTFPDGSLWQSLKFQFDHVPWVGCAFWDLIQPSFMFMVGVALPYSYAKREATGESFRRMLGHAAVRSLVLILIGLFLSTGSKHTMTNFTFVNVLTQIGLGYTFLFLLWRRSPGTQLSALIAILVGYWAWFALTPAVGSDFDFTKVGVPADWPFLTGFAAHWQKNANPAATFDLWFLNLFPRPEPFVFNEGGYQTLNFIPSLGTMLLGLMTGEFIRRSRGHAKTFFSLTAAGVVCLGAGWVLNEFGLCPAVKRIWTPSWALYSTGWTLLMLAGFYGVIDGLGAKAWSWPLKVAGMNSIALYVLSQLLKNWTGDTLQRHLGAGLFNLLGEAYAPLLRANLILLCFWLFVWWLYRQRIFFRI